jgi:predicted aspartyl protease
MRKSYYATSNTIITSTITGNANGEITLSMTAANTANLTPGRQVFDLLITSPTQVKTRVVEGIIVISPGVTR